MKATLRASERFCATLARREARNFYYSFLVLPRARRRSMCALYAFMRQTDDLADGPESTDAKRFSLEAWRRDLDLALEGTARVSWPGGLALADVVKRHGIPRQHLNEVIDGVSMDLVPHTYETFEDLYLYCYRVASAVGLCCLPIWGYRSEHGQAEGLAEACGIALQLTNILRDVREDACMGRVYLPQQELRRFQVEPAELRGPGMNERLRPLFEFQAARAESFYEQAVPLEQLVAAEGRPMLRAIVGIYRALLDEIKRRDYDVLSRRVTIPPWKKALITVRSFLRRSMPAATSWQQSPAELREMVAKEKLA